MGPPLFFGVLFTGGLLPALLQNCGLEIRAVERAQVALRRARVIARRVPLAGPHLARARADDVAEDAAERPETLPAGFEGDVRDRQFRLAQHRGRAFDTAREQVAVRRNAEGLL